MPLIMPSLVARFLTRLHAARMRSADFEQTASAPHPIQRPHSLRALGTGKASHYGIAEWESAWIDLGGEG
jgi:hypothetical protein